MGTYRNVNTKFWNDPKVRALRPNAKFVFLYLVTGPQGHVSGIYSLNVDQAARETGLSRDTLLDTLSDTLFNTLCEWDPHEGIVFVRRMLKIQGKGPSVMRCVQSHVEALPAFSPCVASFAASYPESGVVAAPHTLSNRVSDTLPPDPPRHPSVQDAVAGSGDSLQLQDQVSSLPPPAVAATAPKLVPHFRPKRAEPPSSPAGATSPAPERRPAPTRALLDHWVAASAEVGYGKPATMGQHVKAVSDLWKMAEEDFGLCVETIRQFFLDRDQFVVENGHGVGLFQKKVNAYFLLAKGVILGVEGSRERAMKRNLSKPLDDGMPASIGSLIPGATLKAIGGGR